MGFKDLDATQNPNLGLTALRDDLTVQPLSNPEPLGDFSCHVLRNDLTVQPLRLRWENFNSTGGVLYSAGEPSYTSLGDIKTVGDIKPF